MDEIFKLFSSMLFNILLRSGQNVIWLIKDILLLWDIPDVNSLRVDKDGPHKMFIYICSTAEVWYDQPAGQNQLCIWPYGDPAKDSRLCKEVNTIKAMRKNVLDM